jgi:D-glycero-D-manno-heptose 1,7-bisphosphate phosphatase
MKTIIAAGGIGSRLNSSKSKPLTRIHNESVIERQIKCLNDFNLKDILITLCHKKDDVIEHLRLSGLNARYFVELEPLGDAGALPEMIKYKILSNEDFLFVNGDIIFEFDFEKLLKYHESNDSDLTLVVHKSSHIYDSDIVKKDKDGKVVAFYSKNEEKPEYYENCTNAGIAVISKRMYSLLEKMHGKVSFKDIIRMALECDKKVMAYSTAEYIKDMGTPDRLKEVENDIKNNIATKKSKAIFLDRDGVLNVFNGFVNEPDQLEVSEEAALAVKEINKSDYMAIVVTNQGGIALGYLDEEKLYKIHCKLEMELAKYGAYLDDIIYCPHYPATEKEKNIGVEELKVECDCRKPYPGMLFKAEKKFNIDLSKSIMVGDNDSDVKAGLSAGCKISKKIIANTFNKNHIEVLIKMSKIEDKETRIEISDAIDILVECFAKEGKLLIAGNGGSSSDSEHIVGELMKGFKIDRKIKNECFEKNLAKMLTEEEYNSFEYNLQEAMPAISLSSHTSLCTAYSNDKSFDFVYAQQVYGYGKCNDVLLVLSTSGKSKNVKNAMVVAKALGMKVISLTGFNDELDDLSDVCIKVKEKDTCKIQEQHIKIYHFICEALESFLFEKK